MQIVGRLPGGWSHVPQAVRLISLLLTNLILHIMPPKILGAVWMRLKWDGEYENGGLSVEFTRAD